MPFENFFMLMHKKLVVLASFWSKTWFRRCVCNKYIYDLCFTISNTPFSQFKNIEKENKLFDELGYKSRERWKFCNGCNDFVNGRHILWFRGCCLNCAILKFICCKYIFFIKSTNLKVLNDSLWIPSTRKTIRNKNVGWNISRATKPKYCQSNLPFFFDHPIYEEECANCLHVNELT